MGNLREICFTLHMVGKCSQKLVKIITQIRKKNEILPYPLRTYSLKIYVSKIKLSLHCQTTFKISSIINSM